MKKKIVITGGSGRFAQTLKKYKNKYQLFYPTKQELNILKIKSIKIYLKKIKPNYLIHMAGMSRPMVSHESQIVKSIDLNIIGTANITKICSELNIKLIYFSTSYVYPGSRGNYKEKDPVKPFNNYAWSKLGGECSVQMYKNSLILRICMTEFPFVHNNALCDVYNSFIFHHEVVSILFKILNKKGILNIGGKRQTIYDFAKKSKPNIKKIYLKKIKNVKMPNDSSINIGKLKKYL